MEPPMRSKANRNLTRAWIVVAASISTACWSQSAAVTKTPYFPGMVVSLNADDMPPPFATPSSNNPPRLISEPEGAHFTVPPGFAVREFARGFDEPRIVRVAPNGDIFVVESHAGRVTVLRDADHNGVPEARSVFLDHLDLPFGLAFHSGHVYVANTDSVVRVPYHDGDLVAAAAPETVLSGLPGGGYRQHWTRDLAVDASGEFMYLSVGSRTNASLEEPPRASIIRFRPDGSGQSVFASGLRNAVGLGWNPATHALWATVNERDGLGDNLVPDYFTHVIEGGFYGWPFSYIGSHRDPRVEGGDELVARAIVPDLLIQSHSAPLGFCFYEGAMFPAQVRGDAFIALHGSWNRSARTGYSVIRVPFDADGKPLGWYEHFLRGWLLGPEDVRVWGRPVDVAVASDGSLLITDDGGNRVWRVTYSPPSP
jgi:glucose/arabinose dehydrogenase